MEKRRQVGQNKVMSGVKDKREAVKEISEENRMSKSVMRMMNDSFDGRGGESGVGTHLIRCE